MKSSAAHGNRAAPGPLARLLAKRGPVILDGAMGTELERRGFDTGLPLWSANALTSSPGAVLQIHKEYIHAGADIITTDTFRTTPRSFLRAGLPDRSAELTTQAVALARESREASPGRNVLIAGSMAPLEDCYRPELVPSGEALRREHTLHAKRLAESGVDLLLLETMGTVRESCAAAEAAAATGLEFVVSFLCTPEGLLYSDEQLADAVRLIAPFSPAAFSINCVSPRHIGRALEELQRAAFGIPEVADIPLGLYANVGIPGEEHGTVLLEDIGPEEYAGYAADWTASGVSIIGGCCGAGPEHIHAVAAALRKGR